MGDESAGAVEEAARSLQNQAANRPCLALIPGVPRFSENHILSMQASVDALRCISMSDAGVFPSINGCPESGTLCGELIRFEGGKMQKKKKRAKPNGEVFRSAAAARRHRLQASEDVESAVRSRGFLGELGSRVLTVKSKCGSG